MRTPFFFALAAAFAGTFLTSCGSQSPDAVTVGLLAPGSTMELHVAAGSVNLYKPEAGSPSNRFTVAVYRVDGGPAPPVPQIVRTSDGIRIDIRQPVGSLLVRVPQGVNATVDLGRGNVTVNDIDGIPRVSVKAGDIRLSAATAADARTDAGTIDASVSATSWKGTLQFFAGTGDVNVSVSQIAKFRARLHTDDGSTYTNFPITGTSTGTHETIDAPVNGGSSSGVNLQTRQGSVRLLQLAPQG